MRVGATMITVREEGKRDNVLIYGRGNESLIVGETYQFSNCIVSCWLHPATLKHSAPNHFNKTYLQVTSWNYKPYSIHLNLVHHYPGGVGGGVYQL